jgi:hypothetical protein
MLGQFKSGPSDVAEEDSLGILNIIFKDRGKKQMVFIVGRFESVAGKKSSVSAPVVLGGIP